MSRIGKAYEARFRALLLRLRTRQPEAGVAWLLAKSRFQAADRHIPLNNALAEQYKHLRDQVRSFEQHSRPTKDFSKAPPLFLCDAGLGGLARWLRAAGYGALWNPTLDDAALLREAIRLKAFLITTDSLMMERGVLRDGVILTLWLPPSGGSIEQLATVLRELDLPIRDPRCMHCGGQLHPAEKESVRERIPPKTRLWINDYFLCGGCGKLFWRGTHWQRIQSALDHLAPAPAGG